MSSVLKHRGKIYLYQVSLDPDDSATYRSYGVNGEIWRLDSCSYTLVGQLRDKLQYRRAKVVSDGTDIFLCFPGIEGENLRVRNKTITVSQNPNFTSEKKYIDAPKAQHQSSIAVTKSETLFPFELPRTQIFVRFFKFLITVVTPNEVTFALLALKSENM